MKFLSLAIASLINLSLVGVVNGEDRRMIVGYIKEKEGKAAIKANAKSVHYDLSNQNALAVTLPDQAIEALRKNPNIAYVEEDVKRYPFRSVRGVDAHFNNQDEKSVHRHLSEFVPYGISMVQADKVEFDPNGMKKVCIIDSGYSSTHEDLPTSNVAGTNDPGGTGAWNKDGDGHGTHVAGTIAAMQNNKKGVIGVSPGVALHIVRVFGDNGSWAYSSSLTNAIDICANDASADIISMSLGGGSRSRTEENALEQAYTKGVLSIAAAGNGGNKKLSYPASYSIVVSVAAVDQNEVVADFSTYNSQVEIAAPGVDVLSTVPMGEGARDVAVSVGVTNFDATAMEGAASGSNISGQLVDCGLGDSPCTGASGGVCLIQRGDISFADKVQHCEESDGVAAIIYNNEAGIFSGTLDPSSSGIPAVGISDVDGAELRGKLGMTTVSISTSGGNYDKYSGTSMATPHVAGVAALVWSNHPTCSNQDIRNALTSTAKDKGSPGRDVYYGHGIVQADDANTLLQTNCGNSGTNPPSTPDSHCAAPGDPCTDDDNSCCGSSKCKGKPGSKTCK